MKIKNYRGDLSETSAGIKTQKIHNAHHAHVLKEGARGVSPSMEYYM